MLFFGSDVLEFIVFFEIWYGLKGFFVGVCIKLGWIVIGCLFGYIEDGEFFYKVYLVIFDGVFYEIVKILWWIENFGCWYDCDVYVLLKMERCWSFWVSGCRR